MKAARSTKCWKYFLKDCTAFKSIRIFPSFAVFSSPYSPGAMPRLIRRFGTARSRVGGAQPTGQPALKLRSARKRVCSSLRPKHPKEKPPAVSFFIGQDCSLCFWQKTFCEELCLGPCAWPVRPVRPPRPLQTQPQSHPGPQRGPVWVCWEQQHRHRTRGVWGCFMSYGDGPGTCDTDSTSSATRQHYAPQLLFKTV